MNNTAPTRKLSPLVDGRKKNRRGSAWVSDLFSTRQDYTDGILYNSRLQLAMQETHATLSRQRPVATTTTTDNDTTAPPLLVSSVQVEAQRKYLLAVRSAINNPDLHHRIVVETGFVGTLTCMKQNNQKAMDGGDLIISALSSEVFSLACHSSNLNVREYLLSSGGTQLILDFTTDAVRRIRGYSTRTLQLIGMAASALVSLSTLEHAPRGFARAKVFSKLQSWKRLHQHMHIHECLVHVLFNIARSTPRSHPTYWLQALVFMVSAEYVSNDGTNHQNKHLCLLTTQILVRVMEVKGVPSTVTKGTTKILTHALLLVNNAATLWKKEHYAQWQALLEAVCALVYLVTCSTKAISHVIGSDPGASEEDIMELIATLTELGFAEHSALRYLLHGTSMAAVANIARMQRYRLFLIEHGAVAIIDQVMASAVVHNEPHHVALCVVTLRTLAKDDQSNTHVVQLGGLGALLNALKYANSSAEEYGRMSSALFRIEILAASSICGMMSCSDIGELVQVIGKEVERILQEMLRQRDMLLQRHPELLGPFVTMIRNMSCTTVGMKIYGRLRGLAKTLTGMSKLIPMPELSIDSSDTNIEGGNNTDDASDDTDDASDGNTGRPNVSPIFSFRSRKEPRWHPVWGLDAKGKLGGPKDDDMVVDQDGNTVRDPKALEQEYMQLRISIAATLFNMSTIRRCCTHQIAKPHMIRYFLAIMVGDNGDGTFQPGKKYSNMHRVQELTVATLLEISRIFKTAGQQFSELGAIDLLVRLAVQKFDTKKFSNTMNSMVENKAVEEERRAALNTSILAVSTMCALTSLACNAEVFIRLQVPQALLLAGSRAASPQPIRLRCAIALNNLVYHHTYLFATEIIVLKSDRRLMRRAGHVGSAVLSLPLARSKLKSKTVKLDGESARIKSINASMFLSMLGDVDAGVRNYATSAMCHLTMREYISHKWLVRSGGVHQMLLTGLVRASRDEQKTRRRGTLAFIRLCSEAGRKWLRRRPFSTPRVVWAATSMVQDGDFHKQHPLQKFDDSGEFKELGLVLLLYLSATPHGRVLVGNGHTMEVIVNTALLCVSRKSAQPKNAKTLLRLCVTALVNVCCGIGSGVLESPRDNRGQLRRLDDVGSASAYTSEVERRAGTFQVIANRGLVEKIVLLTKQCGFQNLKVELGSVVCSLVLTDQIDFDLVEEAGAIPCLLELTQINPKSADASVDIGHWTSLQEHAVMTAFHISLLSRITRDYMIRSAVQGCIELCLLPIHAHTFTNRAKDLAIRSLETFCREPVLRPLVLSLGLLKFVRDLVEQHQGPVVLHRRALIISRTIRLITRRFPRFVTFKAKEDAIDNNGVGDGLSALFGGDSEGDGKAGDSDDEEEEMTQNKGKGSKRKKEKHNQTNRSVWHILATKGIVGLLLKLANSSGDNLGLIHADCGRILRNITEDADACVALAKLPSEREKMLELMDVFIDGELEFGARSGAKSSSFSMVNITGVDHASWGISNLMCVAESRRAFIESDVLLSLEAVCISTAATETSIDAASKAVLAMLFDSVVGVVGGGRSEEEAEKEEEAVAQMFSSMAAFEISQVCCNEILEAGGHRTIRGMFEEVRRQQISLTGARRLGLALLTLIEFCQLEQQNDVPKDLNEAEAIESQERIKMLFDAEVYMLKATEGDQEKLIGLSEMYSDKLVQTMCQPMVMLAENDEANGHADLGKLLGKLQHSNVQEHGFVAKFTRVVPWPKTSYTTYPDVPQGMRLQRRPKVINPWPESNTAPVKSNKGSNNRPALVPLTGYNGIVLCDAVNTVKPVFNASNSLDLVTIQAIAKRTHEEETKRILVEADQQIKQQAHLDRLNEAESNLIRWQLIDKKNNTAHARRIEYENQIRLAASQTVQHAANKSTMVIEALRNKHEYQSAHTKSAVRLKKIESSVMSMREDAAKSFVAQMRSEGEKSLAKTHKRTLSAMASLMRQ